MLTRKSWGRGSDKNSKAGILHLLCSLLPRLLRPWFIHTIYVWLIMILVYLNEIHIIHLPPPFTSFPLKRYLFFFNFRCKTPNENDYYTPPGEVLFNTSHGVQSYNVTECHIQINGTMSKCNRWVYDKNLFTATIISKVIQWLIDWLVFNATFSNISAISWRG
jgi:hypothetical protein